MRQQLCEEGCAYVQKDRPTKAAQSSIRSRLFVVSSAMTTTNPHGLTQLRDALRQFAAERDWDQYHSPKNLAAALAVEAAELLERFQWLTEDQSRALPPPELEKVRQEMADVL